MLKQKKMSPYIFQYTDSFIDPAKLQGYLFIFNFQKICFLIDLLQNERLCS